MRYSYRELCPYEQVGILPNTIVRFKTDIDGYPFEYNERLLYLGEISNMRGHCIVVKQDGTVIWGYHTDNFEEYSDSVIVDLTPKYNVVRRKLKLES